MRATRSKQIAFVTRVEFGLSDIYFIRITIERVAHLTVDLVLKWQRHGNLTLSH